MELIILSGFLGSGKTTFLLSLARRMVDAKRRVTIIENEVGEIGIDGQYLRRKGLDVQELFGGCICCTLSAGLVPTLEKIKANFNPDLVILEATGVARPGDIRSTLSKYGAKTVKKISVITIVDTLRFDVLIDVMNPLITAQIEKADIVVINKIDRVDEEKVSEIRSAVSSLNPGVDIVPISAEKGINVQSVTKRFIS
jgi:G3E family GTPase